MIGVERRLIEYHFAGNNGTGMTVRTVQRIVKQVANKAGIPKLVTPHMLRHTYLVSCIKKGISTRSLMTLLAHDRLAATEIYINLSPEYAVKQFQNKW